MEAKWARLIGGGARVAGVGTFILATACASPFNERQIPADQPKSTGCRGTLAAGRIVDEVEAAYEMRRPDSRVRTTPIPENLLITREWTFEELTCGKTSLADLRIQLETVTVCDKEMTVQKFREELTRNGISDNIGRHEAVDKFAAIECPVSFWQSVVNKISNFLSSL